MTQYSQSRSPLRRFHGLFFACAIAFGSIGFTPSEANAQSESTDQTYVEIQSIKVREDGKKRVIALKAKTPALPVGCKVQFLLTWRYQEIESYLVTVPSNKRIDEEFVVRQYSPSPEHYVIHTRLLEPDKQPKKVEREITGNPNKFPPGAVPWAEFHNDHKFLLGTAEEIQAEQKRIQDWFKDRYIQFATLDKQVSDAASAVGEGAGEFVDKKGEFVEKKWRKWLDSDVLKPIREQQKEFDEGLLGKRGDLISYRMPLSDLRELSRAVAWRVTAKSIELYKEQGLEPAKEDVEPEEIKTTVRGFKRRPPKGKDLQKMVSRINSALGIDKKKASGGTR